jgi:hypothetical protein
MNEVFEVPQQSPWRAVLIGGILTVSLMGAFGVLFGDLKAAAGGMAFWAVFFAVLGLSIRFSRRGRPRAFRVAVTDTTLRVPQRRSAAEDEIPLDEITGIAVMHEKSFLNQVRVRIRCGHCKRTIASRPIQATASVDALAQFLTERLGPRGIRVTRYDTRFLLRWPPRFSIATALVVTTCVAVFLGLRAWLEPRFPVLRGLEIGLLGVICMYAPVVMIISGARTLAVGGIAYVIGGSLEFRIVQGYFAAAPAGPPAGWESSTAVWWRYLDPNGTELMSMLLSMGLGILTSAVLSACAAMLLCLAIGAVGRGVSAWRTARE